MDITKLFNEFFKSEKAGGIILIACTVFSLYLANSPWQGLYVEFWQTNINGHSVEHWINDGLMAIFFLLIGLELEREVYGGELSSRQKAALPVVAALGGMVVPAALYTALNQGLPSQSGAGIPMATDIAFAIGILSLLGNRVPVSLKVLLTALAVIDDLGAILVIAIFYSTTLSFVNLFVAMCIFALLVLLNRLRVHRLLPYLVGGVAMWYFMLNSGVHATITGVLLAFAIPFGKGGEETLSYRLQHFLHKPVAYFIVPLFALANTCLVFAPGWQDGLMEPASLGIALGLVAGKPLGIFLFSYIAVVVGWAALPREVRWKHIIGMGMLGGIGFTMSIFITLLAFQEEAMIVSSKMAILGASLVAAMLGYGWLAMTLRKSRRADYVSNT